MADWGEEDCEFVNDDGFVYKRKKRRLDPTTSAPPPPDPVAEERKQKERRKRALMKLREKYRREMDHWEHLSNTLKSMQEKAQNQLLQRQQMITLSRSVIDSPPPPAPLSESAFRQDAADLLLRVEAEEAIIQDVSNLCYMVEAICNAQEKERMKQSLADLSVWASPIELMASLCECLE
ncbi:uncharacterized protein LOC132284435 [Cornus florida]|uniref:uncharacterized protein LOC132284435 n=1 Tax=Cornus florida TaxID=4283 RepID=UPI00289D9E84|nr:uncharacterized protein LOC132284435 [Cornus florida]